MAALGYAVLVVAAFITLFFVHALMPASLRAALIFGAWLLFPYALLALGLRFLAKDMRKWAATSILTAVGGVAFLTWVIYVAPDAQGPIAVLFTPIYQMIGAGLVLAFFGRSS